jgi:broad specificity phosphatase PhoE
MHNTKIITVRHGTTEFGKSNIIAGRIDIPLSEEGIREAERAKEYVKGIDYDHIISSPLSRSLQTALLATGLDARNIILKKECMERNYGRMQGIPPEQIKQLNPEVQYIRKGNYSHSLNPPEGETFEQLRQRATEFLHYLKENFTARTVLVFSHQTFLQQFHGVLLGLDPYECLELDIYLLEFNFFNFNQENQVQSHYFQRPLKIDPGSW